MEPFSRSDRPPTLFKLSPEEMAKEQVMLAAKHNTPHDYALSVLAFKAAERIYQLGLELEQEQEDENMLAFSTGRKAVDNSQKLLDYILNFLADAGTIGTSVILTSSNADPKAFEGFIAMHFRKQLEAFGGFCHSKTKKHINADLVLESVHNQLLLDRLKKLGQMFSGAATEGTPQP